MFFFAGVVLLSETVLFHATKFVVDYVLAMTVIGCAVAGIGLGALLASRLRCREVDIFGWCCGGTTGCLYLAAYVLLRQPDLLLLLPAAAGVFVFPSTFIARTFARRDARGVYFFDMLGAGTAVGVTVFAYQYLGTEEIFLVLVTVVPLAGACGRDWLPTPSRWRRFSSCLWLLLLSSLGGTLLYQQVNTDALNIVQRGEPRRSQYSRSTTCCVAQVASRSPRPMTACWGASMRCPRGTAPSSPTTGSSTTISSTIDAEDYLEYVKPHQLRFPSSDRRVVYGLVPEPQVFVDRRGRRWHPQDAAQDHTAGSH